MIWIKTAGSSSPILQPSGGLGAANDPTIRSERDQHVRPSDNRSGKSRRRRMEIFAFLFLTAVLLPAFAVATVGSYGLAVWIYQMMAGPPGPPTR